MAPARDLEGDADRTGDAAICEMQALTGAGLTDLGEYLDAMGQAWAAEAADALACRPRSEP